MSHICFILAFTLTCLSKGVMDTKKFWKTVKPLFSNKSKTANTIILHKNNRIIKDNKKTSHTLNKYFTDLTKTLKLKKASPVLKKKSLKHLLRHFKNHSTKKSKKHFNSKEIFTYIYFYKVSRFKDIPVKIMVNLVHIYSTNKHFQRLCKKW